MSLPFSCLTVMVWEPAIETASAKSGNSNFLNQRDGGGGGGGVQHKEDGAGGGERKGEVEGSDVRDVLVDTKAILMKLEGLKQFTFCENLNCSRRGEWKGERNERGGRGGRKGREEKVGGRGGEGR